jgi:WD40 repeat protein
MYPCTPSVETMLPLPLPLPAAGSLDRTIRLWDLTYGMPLSISRPHGGTVRAVALDHTLIASGGAVLVNTTES